MKAKIGDWGGVFGTTIIGIHQVVLGDGRVLYWGSEGSNKAFAGTQRYGIFDPATGSHKILAAKHAVDMFCAAGVVIPGTDKFLIAGGNGSGSPGGQIFDASEESLSRDPANDMAAGRFYPTAVSLSSGQVVVLGGDGPANLIGTPEIFTLGEGWRSLTGATDPDVAANWWYPKAWLNANGEIIYIAINEGNRFGASDPAGSLEIMALDPSGSGSIRQIGDVPFRMDVTSPAAMYDVGKIVIMDYVGNLWHMDINGDKPVLTFAADLGVGDRNHSDMTVLPDGRILINGGTKLANSQLASNAFFESLIYDPFTGDVTTVDSEDVMRLYHSSSVLLADGTILSMGGGGLGDTIDMFDAQIYKPDYFYDEDGSLADRPEITSAPSSVRPGQTFTIYVDDATSIAKMSFVKTGAVTHSVNMESGRMNLDFRVLNSKTIEVTLPDNPHVVGAGNWMLFAIDYDGVPSVAPIISVQPTLSQYSAITGDYVPVDGQISVEYFNIETDSLNNVDFNADPVFREDLREIQEAETSGAFYDGGRSDKFAARYTGEFTVETSGQYTFYLNSDDGSALEINGKEIIDNRGLHAAEEVKAVVYLKAGSHTLTAHYLEYTYDAVMELDWRGPDFARSTFEVRGVAQTGAGDDTTDDTPVAPPQPPTGNSGFLAEYFNIDIYTQDTSDIEFNDPAYTEYLSEINQDTYGSFYQGGREDYFAVRYTGKFEVAQDGFYTFYLKSNDGSRLRIGDDEIITMDRHQSAWEDSARVYLKAGTHDLELKYFEIWGHAAVDLDWSGPGFGRKQMTEVQRPSDDDSSVTVIDGPARDSGESRVPLPPENSGFLAEYFEFDTRPQRLSEINFQATPDHEEYVSTINERAVWSKKWGDTPFYEGGQTDNFAVRYTADFQVSQSGSYTFYLTSDDGSLLKIDGNTLINNDELHSEREDEGTIHLEEGRTYSIELQYFEGWYSAVVDLDWSGPGFGRKQMTEVQRPSDDDSSATVINRPGRDSGDSTVPPAAENSGFYAEYFDIDKDTRDTSDIKFNNPVYTEYLSEINQDTYGSFYDGGRKDYFAVRYTGKIEIVQADFYRFYVKSNDGSRLKIDDDEIINMDWHQSVRETSALVYLEEGTHDIELKYFEIWGHAAVDLDWSGPGFGRTQLTLEEDDNTGLVVHNDDYESRHIYYGSTDRDRFVVDGHSSEWGIGANMSKTAVNVYSRQTGESNYLFNFEEIEFDDQVVFVEDYLV